MLQNTNLNHEILSAISKQRYDDPSVFKKYPEVCHQSEHIIYKLYPNIADQTFAIRSAMIHTPEGSNNTTPSSCQCATIVIEKNSIGIAFNTLRINRLVQIQHETEMPIISQALFS